MLAKKTVGSGIFTPLCLLPLYRLLRYDNKCLYRLLRYDNNVEDLGDFSDFYIKPGDDLSTEQKSELQRIQDEELARLLQEQEHKVRPNKTISVSGNMAKKKLKSAGRKNCVCFKTPPKHMLFLFVCFLRVSQKLLESAGYRKQTFCFVLALPPVCPVVGARPVVVQLSSAYASRIAAFPAPVSLAPVPRLCPR